MKQAFKIAAVGFIFALIILLTACDKENNHRTFEELAEHFRKNGIKIEQVQPVRADVLKASSAIAFKISGQEIGVYKYDTSLKVQRQKIEKVTAEGFVYVLGLKFPVLVNGSFLILGAHQNPEKQKIIKAFMSF